MSVLAKLNGNTAFPGRAPHAFCRETASPATAYVASSWAGPGGSQVIYDSTSDNTEHVNFVGGDYGFEDRIGLHEATDNLEEFFFLDTLNSGESGVVTLTVSLEGETQGNIYQNTAARIQMNFAVELKDAGGKTLLFSSISLH